MKIRTNITIMDKLKTIGALCALLLSFPAAAHMEDDPLLFMLNINELEIHDAEGDPLSWDIASWVGKDLHKFRLQTEGEQGDNGTESAEVQVLYSRAVAAYWDFQLGLRHDQEPGPARDWAVIGWRGLAPYWFEINTVLFIGEDGRSALRFETEYEVPITRRLILNPEVEINFYGKEDPELGIGSGLSDVEAGLRLRYEIRPEFAPYIGVNWERVYGGSEDFARVAGEDAKGSELVFGIKAWF
jgi:copper resistance protein B